MSRRLVYRYVESIGCISYGSKLAVLCSGCWKCEYRDTCLGTWQSLPCFYARQESHPYTILDTSQVLESWSRPPAGPQLQDWKPWQDPLQHIANTIRNFDEFYISTCPCQHWFEVRVERTSLGGTRQELSACRATNNQKYWNERIEGARGSLWPNNYLKRRHLHLTYALIRLRLDYRLK